MTASEHERFMRRAIELACENLRRPFGSVLVDVARGEVVAEGRNKNYSNPILHSDVAAIHTLAQSDREVDWSQLALYATAEPNAMCMAAVLWAGIPQVYFGTSLPRLAELGFRQIDIPAVEMVERAVNLDCTLTGGVCGEECDNLFAAAARLEQNEHDA